MAVIDLEFGVDTSVSSSNIKDQLTGIIREIEPLKVKAEIDIDVSNVKNWESDIKKIFSRQQLTLDVNAGKSISDISKQIKSLGDAGDTAKKSVEKISYSYKDAEAAIKKYQKIINSISQSNADIVWDSTYEKYKSASGVFSKTAEALNDVETEYVRVIDAMESMPLEEQIKLQKLLTAETEKYNLAIEAQAGKEIQATNYSDATRAVKEYYAALTKLAKTPNADVAQINKVYEDSGSVIHSYEWASENEHYSELADSLNRTKTAYDLVIKAKSSMTDGQQARLQALITQEQQKYNQVLEDQANKERAATEAAAKRASAQASAKQEAAVYSDATRAVKEYYETLLEYKRTESNDITLTALDDGTVGYKSASGQYDELAKALNRTQAAYDGVVASMESLSESNQAKLADDMTKASNEYALALEKIINKQKESAAASSDAATKQAADIKELMIHISGINSAYKDIITGKLGENLGLEEIQTIKDKYIELQQEIVRMNQEGATGTNSHIDRVRALQIELTKLLEVARKTGDDFSPGSDANTKAYTKVNDLLADITRNQREWTKAQNGFSKDAYNSLSEYANQLKDLANKLKAGTITQEDFNKSFDSISSNVKSANKQIYAAGEATRSWSTHISDLAKKFASWLSATQIVSTIWNGMKKMASTVVEIDSAMTELKKVTDATDATYDRFLTNAASRAKEVGATISDVVTATADFARLGYSIDEASTLADTAIVYKNVADGISDISEASESIISAMKAFDIEAEDSITIADKYNEVSNKFAISSSGIGEAMQRSASALSTANNSIDESIALITAAM